MARYSRIQPVALGVQLLQLKRLQLENAVGKFTGANRICYEYNAKASPIGRTYRLQLTLSSGESPKVRVLDPDIFELSKGKQPPHIESPSLS